MPLLEVTTKKAEQVWASPDGQRVIYELEMEWQGKPVRAKTYSKDIATVGWFGNVETYERPGRKGPETFVKQPQKEGDFRGGGKPRNAPSDTFTMYLSYAKDLVVAHITSQTKEGAALSLDDSVAAIIQYGIQLYENRPNAPVRAVVEKEPDGTQLDKVQEQIPDTEDLGNILDEIPEEFK